MRRRKHHFFPAPDRAERRRARAVLRALHDQPLVDGSEGFGLIIDDPIPPKVSIRLTVDVEAFAKFQAAMRAVAVSAKQFGDTLAQCPLRPSPQ